MNDPCIRDLWFKAIKEENWSELKRMWTLPDFKKESQCQFDRWLWRSISLGSLDFLRWSVSSDGIEWGRKVLFNKVADLLDNPSEDNAQRIAALMPACHDEWVDTRGRSLLSHAVLNGQTEIAKQMLERGADLQRVDDQGENLLFDAVRSRRSSMVQMILPLVNPLQLNHARETPLMLAVSLGCSKAILESLVEVCDVTQIDWEGNHALLLAVLVDHFEAMKVLMPRNDWHHENIKGESFWTWCQSYATANPGWFEFIVSYKTMLEEQQWMSDQVSFQKGLPSFKRTGL